jgi:hypothetical protein
MINIQLLEESDTVRADDWCRPLVIRTMDSGEVSFRCMYSGVPENNVEWVQAKYIFGKMWFGCRVIEFNSKIATPYEFARGDIPKRSRLNMDDYTDITKFGGAK